LADAAAFQAAVDALRDNESRLVLPVESQNDKAECQRDT
jgi:hypothetical protein